VPGTLFIALSYDFITCRTIIEQNSLKRSIEEYRPPSGKNSWINPCGCNNVNKKWKIYTLLLLTTFLLLDAKGKNIGIFLEKIYHFG